MNDKKLNHLFARARQASAPEPPPDFAHDVLRETRRETAGRTMKAVSLFDQLNMLFSRIAMTAVAIIVLSLATDFALTSAGYPGLDNGVSQLSSQWLFNPEDI